MRFCMITTFYPPFHHGGDGTYIRALSEALVKRGHEVTVVHCEDAYRMSGLKTIDEEDHGAIKVHRLRSKAGFLSPLITQQTGRPGLKAGQLKKILADDFDVVHFHNISLIGGPGVIALSHAKINLYTLHEHWLVCPTHTLWKNKTKACDKPECLRCCLKSGLPPQLWRQTGFLKRSLKAVDRFLAPSQFTADQHRKLGIGPIDVLPLFSNLSPLAPEDLSAGKLSFITVGRLTASKGIAELARSFAKWPQLELHVVGDGEDLPVLQRELAQHKHIHLHGKLPQQQLISLYMSATALILPSLAPETFGLTVVEALACGVPAIVRIAGGNREIVDASGAGFLYQSEEELAAVLAKFQAQPGLRGELGAKGRVAFEALYTEARHVHDYLELVQQTLREKGQGLGTIEHGN